MHNNRTRRFDKSTQATRAATASQAIFNPLMGSGAHAMSRYPIDTFAAQPPTDRLDSTTISLPVPAPPTTTAKPTKFCHTHVQARPCLRVRDHRELTHAIHSSTPSRTNSNDAAPTQPEAAPTQTRAFPTCPSTDAQLTGRTDIPHRSTACCQSFQ